MQFNFSYNKLILLLSVIAISSCASSSDIIYLTDANYT